MIPFIIFQIWIAFHTPMETPRLVISLEPIQNSRVLDIVSKNHKVLTGFVCFSELDIKCIDNICTDEQKNLYWSIRLNGEYDNVNSQTLVVEKDSLVLEYASLKEK